jgi:hypothetical protein
MDPPAHLLAAAVLLARLADVGSTYLVSPDLALEANGLVRRFRWPFALLTSSLCLVAYVSRGLAIIVLVASLLVSSSNIRNAWLVRGVGETRYLDFLHGAAAASSRWKAVASVLASAALVGLAGLVLLLFYPSPSWAWYFAFGMLGYAFALALHGSAFVSRLFRATST